MLAGEMPTLELNRPELDAGIGLVDLLLLTGLVESKGAGRKLIEGGGVYLGSERQTDARKRVSADDLNWPGAILLRAGKKNYHLVLVAPHAA